MFGKASWRLIGFFTLWKLKYFILEIRKRSQVSGLSLYKKLFDGQLIVAVHFMVPGLQLKGHDAWNSIFSSHLSPKRAGWIQQLSENQALFV